MNIKSEEQMDLSNYCSFSNSSEASFSSRFPGSLLFCAQYAVGTENRSYNTTWSQRTGLIIKRGHREQVLHYDMITKNRSYNTTWSQRTGLTIRHSHREQVLQYDMITENRSYTTTCSPRTGLTIRCGHREQVL